MSALFAQSIRRSCSACGSTQLRWSTGKQVRARPGGTALLGSIVGDGLTRRQVDRADVWECGRCDNVGVIA